MTDEMSEEVKKRISTIFTFIRNGIVLCAPVMGWIFHLWMENRFNEFEERIANKYISAADTRSFYHKDETVLATRDQFTKVNAIVQTHQADSSMHYPKSEVVSSERFDGQIAVIQGSLNNIAANQTELKADFRALREVLINRGQ